MLKSFKNSLTEIESFKKRLQQNNEVFCNQIVSFEELNKKIIFVEEANDFIKTKLNNKVFKLLKENIEQQIQYLKEIENSCFEFYEKYSAYI